jgi:RNA polymerase sigma-70 factor (ECF subfamily)
VKPWLARIAANQAKDHLKSAYNRKMIVSDHDAMPEEKGALFIQMEQPEDIALDKDAVACITQDIKSLKEPYHQVAVLYFLEERSVDEIATHLKRPPKTVHTQLYRAKHMLQQKLKGGDEYGLVP